MHTREELSTMVEDYIAALPLPRQPEGLYAPIRYALEGGGKRIRPLLALMACELFGGDPADALPCAAAIEVYHNFTLLHDDIMDNAPVRRGKPAVHKKWNANTAILSGDAMTIWAYRMLERLRPEHLAPVLAEVNRCWTEICEGQQYDMDFERRDDVTIAEYMEMIRLKTSVMLATAAKTGSIAGGATGREADAMYDFALNLGTAFQIQDDLLDTFGTEQQLGKKTGGDILEGKKTFLLLTALESASEEEARELRALMADRGISPEMKIAMVRGVYDRLGVKLAAEAEVETRTAAALAILAELSAAGRDTAPLAELARELIKRVK